MSGLPPSQVSSWWSAVRGRQGKTRVPEAQTSGSAVTNSSPREGRQQAQQRAFTRGKVSERKRSLSRKPEAELQLRTAPCCLAARAAPNSHDWHGHYGLNVPKGFSNSRSWARCELQICYVFSSSFLYQNMKVCGPAGDP